MAQGSVVRYNGTTERFGLGNFDLDTQTLVMALVNAVPQVTDGTTAGEPTLSDYTVVSGGTYANKTLVVGTDYDWTRIGVHTYLVLDLVAHPNGQLTWAQDATNGPQDIRGMILYESTNNRVLEGWDMTPDGTTPISLRTAAITVTANPGGTAGHMLSLLQGI